MKGMNVLEQFTILTVPSASDEVILSHSDEELQRTSYNLFKVDS
jgi:hypothetical protein